MQGKTYTKPNGLLVTRNNFFPAFVSLSNNILTPGFDTKKSPEKNIKT